MVNYEKKTTWNPFSAFPAFLRAIKLILYDRDEIRDIPIPITLCKPLKFYENGSVSKTMPIIPSVKLSKFYLLTVSPIRI